MGYCGGEDGKEEVTNKVVNTPTQERRRGSRERGGGGGRAGT